MKKKLKVKNSGIVKLTARKDARRGSLYIAEAKKHVPFPIKRIWLTTDLDKDEKRGHHTHHKLNQAIFCIRGSFTLHLDDGNKKDTVTLSDPSYGVIIGPYLWHHMTDFSPDCLILVLADDYYDEGDYIRSYEDFLKVIGK